MFPTIREHWRRAMVLSTLASILVGLAAMHARSITIAGVRALDHDMIVASLLQVRALPAEARRGAVAAIMAPLHPESRKEPFVGMAVWEGSHQVYADHTLLRDRTWEDVQRSADSDPRFLTSTLRGDPTTPEWRVSFFRPELGHNMSPWLFWLLPFAQLGDPWSMEVMPSTFVRKLGVLFPLTWIAIFAALIGIESWHDRKARRLTQESASLRSRLKHLDARIQEAQKAITAADAAAREAKAALMGERSASEEITSAAAEKEKHALEKLNEAKALSERAEADRVESDTLRKKLATLEEKEARNRPNAASEGSGVSDSQGHSYARNAAEQRTHRVLQALLPTLRFVGESLEVMTRDVPKPDRIVEILKLLSTAPGEVRAQAVANAPGWRELHFGTGVSNDGRIYFQNSDGLTYVYIGFKRDQKRDIRRLHDFRVA